MDKNKILSNLDFREFYSSFVDFPKGNGKSEVMGICPFHNDHHPSLSVNLDKGLFNCFACDAKGDAFTFYQKIKNVDFKTALREIGRRSW